MKTTRKIESRSQAETSLREDIAPDETQTEDYRKDEACYNLFKALKALHFNGPGYAAILWGTEDLYHHLINTRPLFEKLRRERLVTKHWRKVVEDETKAKAVATPPAAKRWRTTKKAQPKGDSATICRQITGVLGCKVMTPTEILAEIVKKNGLTIQSRNPRKMIRNVLVKHPQIFEPAGTKRGGYRLRPNTRPTNREAIKIVLGNKTMHMNDVLEGLKARGWAPSSNKPRELVGYLLSTMRDAFERDPKYGRGYYRVKQEASAPTNKKVADLANDDDVGEIMAAVSIPLAIN